MLLAIARAGADLAIDAERLDERGALHEGNIVRAHDVLERVVGLEIADDQVDRQAGVLQIGVLDRDRVTGEVDLEKIFEVVEHDPLDAEPGAPERRRRNVRGKGDRRVLIDVVVVGLDPPTDLELELLFVGAGEFGRALPFDLQVEVVAAGVGGGGVRCGGLRLRVLNLPLQLLDSGIQRVDLVLDRP